ncbi:MAG: hypothetical protein HFH30_04465 [Eubacterium sp.]|nr:hypothetical protein [Eubacterium sp.]MCI8919348.1 hypothetical protein [Eubacterium sp.]
MSDFKLKKHSVKKASFVENFDKEKKNNLDMQLNGNISVPKNVDKNSHIMINLNFHIGKEDDRFYLAIETLSVFEIENETLEISEESVRKACVPAALTNLRKTVKKVTEAYGMPALDLPPFEGENTEG